MTNFSGPFSSSTIPLLTPRFVSEEPIWWSEGETDAKEELHKSEVLEVDASDFFEARAAVKTDAVVSCNSSSDITKMEKCFDANKRKF